MAPVGKPSSYIVFVFRGYCRYFFLYKQTQFNIIKKWTNQTNWKKFGPCWKAFYLHCICFARLLPPPAAQTLTSYIPPWLQTLQWPPERPVPWLPSSRTWRFGLHALYLGSVSLQPRAALQQGYKSKSWLCNIYNFANVYVCIKLFLKNMISQLTIDRPFWNCNAFFRWKIWRAFYGLCLLHRYIKLKLICYLSNSKAKSKKHYFDYRIILKLVLWLLFAVLSKQMDFPLAREFSIF